MRCVACRLSTARKPWRRAISYMQDGNSAAVGAFQQALRQATLYLNKRGYSWSKNGKGGDLKVIREMCDARHLDGVAEIADGINISERLAVGSHVHLEPKARLRLLCHVPVGLCHCCRRQEVVVRLGCRGIRPRPREVDLPVDDGVEHVNALGAEVLGQRLGQAALGCLCRSESRGEWLSPQAGRRARDSDHAAPPGGHFGADQLGGAQQPERVDAPGHLELVVRHVLVGFPNARTRVVA
mmetsp:Transcript_21509/g.54183  ORF Transcript_21509/g.54183 Transcript_21509/m.54183 type:complete len:240 (-) Transcript_21509:312-1031(-)